MTRLCLPQVRDLVLINFANLPTRLTGGIHIKVEGNESRSDRWCGTNEIICLHALPYLKEVNSLIYIAAYVFWESIYGGNHSEDDCHTKFKGEKSLVVLRFSALMCLHKILLSLFCWCGKYLSSLLFAPISGSIWYWCFRGFSLLLNTCSSELV